jgi:L-alanine-DL-glutamate epimerase-like enolase superfamily enzyme
MPALPSAEMSSRSAAGPTRRDLLRAGAALPLLGLRLPLGRPAAPAVIERCELWALRYAMTGHFKFFTGPHGSRGRASVLLKLTTADGAVGWGQSVPIARWSDETLETVEVALRDYFGPALLGHDADDLDGAERLLDGAVAPGFSTGMPIARAAVDLALHDLAGKRAGLPLAALWGREALRPLRLSWTLNPQHLDEVDELVAAGRARGYRDFNIKAGPDPEADLALARRARELAPQGFLWADANGGYEPETALALAPRLAEAGVDVFEAPLRPNRIAGYQALKRQGALPILMDEGVVSPQDLAEFHRLGMLDGVAMKPSRCGGLRSARAQIEFLEREGLMWLGSGLTDPDVSLAATLILYGAHDLRRPAALNGPQFLTESLLTEPFEVVDGALLPPSGPGLGVEVDEARLAERVRAGRARTAVAGGAAGAVAAGRWAGTVGSRTEEHAVAVLADGQELWRFQHDPAAPHCFFHPLALPGTPPLTADAPADHVHHHGLWFSWKLINGVNFWEHAPGSDRPAGRTEWELLRRDVRGDGSARIGLRLQYASPEEGRVMSEDREILVSAVAADGGYAIDWTGRFTALAERVVLDRTPPPGQPGAKVFGGYAGLSLRLAQLEERGAATEGGPVTFNEQDRFRGNAAAFDYHGSLGGRPVGVAVLDHTENLPHPDLAPTPWYAIRSGAMSFVNAAVLCWQPLELARGDGFTLRYRVLVHPGRWDAARLAVERRRAAGLPEER